jgi:hypothetical protein
MDQNTVYQLFVATYHPDPNVHKQAELNIRNVSCFANTPPFFFRCIFKLYTCISIQIESNNGFLPIVLQILASEELELGARQAGKTLILVFVGEVLTFW